MGMTVPHFCCHFDVIHYLPSQYRALEDCCREWRGVKRAYAYQLIGAVGVVAKFVCHADKFPTTSAAAMVVENVSNWTQIVPAPRTEIPSWLSL